MLGAHSEYESSYAVCEHLIITLWGFHKMRVERWVMLRGQLSGVATEVWGLIWMLSTIELATFRLCVWNPWTRHFRCTDGPLAHINIFIGDTWLRQLKKQEFLINVRGQRHTTCCSYFVSKLGPLLCILQVSSKVNFQTTMVVVVTINQPIDDNNDLFSLFSSSCTLVVCISWWKWLIVGMTSC